jgi:cytochrome c oxidase subunit 1
MAMAGIFGLFAATYYWFPLITGRLMSEPLGRWHFWLTLIGAYATFLPMHLTGLAGEPRHYSQLSGIPNAAGILLANTLPLNRHITYAAIFLAASQVLFFINLARSFHHGSIAPENPWQATTLEWHPALQPNTLFEASKDDEPIAVYRRPCQYPSNPTGVAFIPQWIPDITLDTKPE